jgi:hypothetical protein
LFGIISSRKQYCYNTSNETVVSFLLEVAFVEEKHVEGRRFPASVERGFMHFQSHRG